ncbi:MAG: DUF2288 domain-containing protein [Bdellovibrionia bacterium]|jgi:hypothetical protein
MTQLKKDLKTTLEESLDQAEWNWIAPHAERQAVVVVSQDLNIIEVGIKIAEDDAKTVQDWIGRELLSKPSPTQVRTWEQNPGKRFSTLVVQPYVLIQEKAN